MSTSRMSKVFRRFLGEGLRGPDPADGERLKFGSSLRGCFRRILNTRITHNEFSMRYEPTQISIHDIKNRLLMDRIRLTNRMRCVR
jgi:hypothetical protein